MVQKSLTVQFEQHCHFCVVLFESSPSCIFMNLHSGTFTSQWRCMQEQTAAAFYLFLIAMFAFACRMGWYTRTQRWGRQTTYPLRCSSRREGKAAMGGSVTGGLWAWCFMKCWSVSNTTDAWVVDFLFFPFFTTIFFESLPLVQADVKSHQTNA